MMLMHFFIFFFFNIVRIFFIYKSICSGYSPEYLGNSSEYSQHMLI